MFILVKCSHVTFRILNKLSFLKFLSKVIAKVFGFSINDSQKELEHRLYKELHLPLVNALNRILQARKVNSQLFGAIGAIWSYHLE